MCVYLKKKKNCIRHKQMTHFYWHYNYVSTTGTWFTIAYHISIFLSFYTRQCFYLTQSESSSTNSRSYQLCLLSYWMIFHRPPKPLKFKVTLVSFKTRWTSINYRPKRPDTLFFESVDSIKVVDWRVLYTIRYVFSQSKVMWFTINNNCFGLDINYSKI